MNGLFPADKLFLTVGGAVIQWPYLKMGNVSVHVERGGHTVLGDILVIDGARFGVLAIKAGYRDILIAPGYVPLEKAGNVDPKSKKGTQQKW